MSNPGFRQRFAGVLLPERKWHWLFPLLVVAVSSAYWVGSLVSLPSGSLPEAIVYRPEGDNEHCPIIASLSHFNFGDPTDSKCYGQGLGSFPVVGCLPHAMACAVFGNAGYPVADVALSLLYFLVVAAFFRECNLGKLASLILGASLASGGLQTVTAKLGEWAGLGLGLLHLEASDYHFPNLAELAVFQKRIPRPMVSEILVVMLLCLALRLWRGRENPSFRPGLYTGGLLGLIAQGDFYSVAMFGFFLAGLWAWCVLARRWRMPWAMLAGTVLGVLVTGWYFFVQRWMEHPDIPRRLGVVRYPRTQLLFLPGYAPILRVAIVAGLAVLFWWMARRRVSSPADEGAAAGAAAGAALAGADSRRKKRRAEKNDSPSGGGAMAETRIAVFFVALMAAAWLVQPLQIFLLGQGTQIYHYLLNVPIYYGYAVVVLGCGLLRRLLSRRWQVWRRKPLWIWIGSAVLALALAGESALAVNKSLERVRTLGTSRGASQVYEPWGALKDDYRPGFRELAWQFRTNAVFRQARTFTTFTVDVNVLLTSPGPNRKVPLVG